MMMFPNFEENNDFLRENEGKMTNFGKTIILKNFYITGHTVVHLSPNLVQLAPNLPVVAISTRPHFFQNYKCISVKNHNFPV